MPARLFFAVATVTLCSAALYVVGAHPLPAATAVRIALLASSAARPRFPEPTPKTPVPPVASAPGPTCVPDPASAPAGSDPERSAGLAWVDMKSRTAGWAWIAPRDVPEGGVAEPGRLLQTADGGRCWSGVSLPRAAGRVHAPLPLDAQVVVAPSDDGAHLFRTSSAGRTWSSVALGDDRHVLGFRLAQATGGRATLTVQCDHGMTSNCDYALHSTDGGRSWARARALPRSGQLVELDRRAWFLNGNVGNSQDTLVRTTNGGRTWQAADWSAGAAHLSWKAYDDEDGWSGQGDVQSMAYLTTRRRLVAAIASRDVGGATHLVRLDDLGARADTVFTAPLGTKVSVLFAASDVLHAVLQADNNESNAKTSLLWSTDGVRWHEVKPAIATGVLGDVDDLDLENVRFVTPTDAFALAEDHRLWRSADAGSTWEPVERCGGGALENVVEP